MTSTALSVTGLTKRYGARTVVDDLDIELPSGVVAGFVGPNGAGKTTTMAMLLGLVRTTAGTGSVLGSPIDAPDAYLSRVGALIESPAFYPSLSGAENLRVFATVAGHGTASIPALLERVGLEDRGDDRYRSYSLGMKQRLGIAAALLKDPAVLILDEPANGLDPAGIVEVRQLVRQLGAEGRTVFISSHILPEIQQTADRVAILARGRCVKTGPVHEVLAARGGDSMLVRVRDLAAGRAALAEAGFNVVEADGILRVSVAVTEAERISRTLAERGSFVTELRPDELDLETVFLELTRDEADEGDGPP